MQVKAVDNMQYNSEKAEVVVGGGAVVAGFSARDSLAEIQRSYEDKVRRYGRELESVKHKVAKLQQNVESTNDALLTMMTTMLQNQGAIQQCMALLTVEMGKLCHTQKEAEMMKSNGVFWWRIPDVSKQYREAVDSKTISIQSLPFYAGPNGYKMCIRIYLNGDGVGKGTHISLFFVLMHSEHDVLLTWPFRQPVSLTLLNQAQSTDSITETFQPDPRSSSCQRPVKDMNTASGSPRFAPQSVLQDKSFAQDDVIYIKCKVDLTGLF
jgi:TNF receptor-associated factor 2/TNF receptor-associated factor 3